MDSVTGTAASGFVQTWTSWGAVDVEVDVEFELEFGDDDGDEEEENATGPEGIEEEEDVVCNCARKSLLQSWTLLKSVCTTDSTFTVGIADIAFRRVGR